MRVSLDARTGRRGSGARLPRWIVDARLDEPLARLHRQTESRIVRYPGWFGTALILGGGIVGWGAVLTLAGLW